MSYFDAHNDITRLGCQPDKEFPTFVHRDGLTANINDERIRIGKPVDEHGREFLHLDNTESTRLFLKEVLAAMELAAMETLK